MQHRPRPRLQRLRPSAASCGGLPSSHLPVQTHQPIPSTDQFCRPLRALSFLSAGRTPVSVAALRRATNLHEENLRGDEGIPGYGGVRRGHEGCETSMPSTRRVRRIGRNVTFMRDSFIMLPVSHIQGALTLDHVPRRVNVREELHRLRHDARNPLSRRHRIKETVFHVDGQGSEESTC